MEDDLARIEPVGDGTPAITTECENAAAITTEGQNIRRKRTKRAGKYTGKAQGQFHQCWSSESIKQCNFLRKLAKTGREADKNCEDEPNRWKNC